MPHISQAGIYVPDTYLILLMIPNSLKTSTIRVALGLTKVILSLCSPHMQLVSSLSQLRPQSRLRHGGLRGPAVMLESRV